MIHCASCKNKTSNEQCTSPVLKGLIFCGKHVKVKQPRLWVDVNNVIPSVIKIQKIWKGFSVRNRISLAGDGCLCRKKCHNDSELVTLDDKTEVHPFNYFSFLENGKNWFFDFRSLNEIFATNPNPTNPYTRQKISLKDRQRFREICVLRKIYNDDLYHTKKSDDISSKAVYNWISVSQIIEENGFEDCINPFIFARMSRIDYYSYLNIFLTDLMSLKPIRNKYIAMTKYILKKIQKSKDYVEITFEVSKLFLSILENIKNPYPICYIIMSSLYKL